MKSIFWTHTVTEEGAVLLNSFYVYLHATLTIMNLV